MNIGNWPIEFVLDPTVPEDEIQARMNGKIVGRITNIQSSHERLVFDVDAALKGYDVQERKARNSDLKVFYIRAEIEGLLQSNNVSDPIAVAAMLDRIEKIIRFSD